MQEVFEKIIGRLESERFCYFLTIANTGDKSFDVAYEKVGEVIDKAIEIVKQEASKYTNGWIPCSERLPERVGVDELYPMNLVTLDNGDVCLGVYRIDDCEWWTRMSEGETGYSNEHKVIAWQPITEKYRGENRKI